MDRFPLSFLLTSTGEQRMLLVLRRLNLLIKLHRRAKISVTGQSAQKAWLYEFLGAIETRELLKKTSSE